MNEHQKLRLKIASEQMAALLSIQETWEFCSDVLALHAVRNADALIAEIERTRNRRQRVLELLRANARGQLRDSMAIFRAHPLRGARRLPDGGVL